MNNNNDKQQKNMTIDNKTNHQRNDERVDNQIKNQQINNELNNYSNISKGMSPYQNYKKSNYKTNFNNPDNNKRMKNQLNYSARKGGSTLGTIDRGINAAKNYNSANTVKEKENAKSQMKGSVANAATTALTGSKTLGNLAEKASKMKDKLNPLKAMKNALLGKINGDEENQTDELGNPKQQENKLENVSFTIPPKVIKWVVIAGVPAFCIIIFVVLFVSASQTYVTLLGIDSADKVTENQLEDVDDNYYEPGGRGATEVDDVDKLNYNYNSNPLIAKADNFIDESENLLSISLVTRKHEADLSEINDYFSDKLKCSGKDCENQPEYLFFLKMNDIYMLYKKKYNVKLDLPLLMSTLSISDEQASEVYIKNSKGYSVEKHEKTIDYIDSNFSGDLLDIDLEYDYKNIDNYIYLSTSDFSYDMQILAQNMVTKNGENYKKDLNNYDDFLEEYIEMKYYVSDDKKKEIYKKEESTPQQSSNNVVNTDYTNWKQCSNEWGNKVIRKDTMCSVGCYVTSIAIQIARSGTQITIDNFNPYSIVENATFTDNDDLINPNFSKYAPNFIQENTIYTSGWDKDSVIDRVSKEISKGKYPILYVDNHHFVAATGTNKTIIFMLDPASDNTNLYSSYTSVTQIQIFSKKD